MDWYSLLDIGGTAIKMQAVSADGSLIGSIMRFPSLSSESCSVIAANVADIAMADGKLGKPLAIAMAFPGPFDYGNGISYMKGLGKYESIYGQPLRPLIAEKLAYDVPMVFINDVEAFALGAAAKCRGRAIAVAIGTGCGSAFISDGRIIKEGPGIPENGWIYVEVFTQEKYVNVQVNGQIVVEVGGSNNSRTPIPFFCLRGDVIQLNVDNASAGGRFFPVKVLESAPATVYKVVNSASSDTYYLSDKPFGLDDINNTEYLSSIKLYSVNNRYRLFNYVVTADSAAGMILIKKPDGTTDTNSLGGQGAGFYAQETE